MKSLYLFIDLFSLLGPLLLSFDKKVAFFRYWKALFPAILIMMIIFIPWDIAKTARGVWGFNEDYILGIYIGNLPLEEWLFFICIPYACIFIYECLNAYIKKDLLQSFYKPLLTVLSFFLIIVGILNYEKWYPAITFPYAGVLILVLLYGFKSGYLSRFFLAYLVTLIPFLVVNGILTGSFIDEQVVWYNPEEIFNIRIGTIPVEDTIYNLGMLTTVITWYEFFKCRFGLGCFNHLEAKSTKGH